jgi:hypothetical protein
VSPKREWHALTHRTLVSTRNLTHRRNASIKTYTAAALRAEEPEPRAFVDRTGQPFPDRIQQTLRRLEPRLRRRFPLIRDEVVLAEILEEAGRLIVKRELAVGPIEKLRGFAWVTIQNVAKSRLRGAPMRLQQATLDSVESEAVLVQLPAQRGSPDAIERRLLVDQISQSLSVEERHVYT